MGLSIPVTTICPTQPEKLLRPLKRDKFSLSVAENIFNGSPCKANRLEERTRISQMRHHYRAVDDAVCDCRALGSTKATPGAVGICERASRSVDDLAILAQICAGAVD